MVALRRSLRALLQLLSQYVKAQFPAVDSKVRHRVKSLIHGTSDVHYYASALPSIEQVVFEELMEGLLVRRIAT